MSSSEPQAPRSEPFQIGDWTVEPALSRLRRGDVSHRLEPKILDVLLHLAASPEEVLSKEQLLDLVWTDTFVAEGVLVRSISELRRVFEDDAKASRYIETIPKKGYRLVAAVSELPAQGAVSQTPPPEKRGADAVASARWGRLVAVAILAAAVSVAVVVALYRRTPEPSLSESPLSGSPAQEVYRRARELYERGQAADNRNAVELYKRTLEKDPHFAPAYAGLAAAYAREARRDPVWSQPAVDAGRQAVKMAPDLAPAHQALGQAYLAAGRWREARDALIRAVELDRTLAPAFHELGLVHALGGQLDEAVRRLKQSLELASPSAQLFADLARSYRLLGEPEAALSRLRLSLELEPFQYLARLEQARLALDAGDLVAARDFVASFVEVDPELPAALDLAALVELTAGEDEVAERWLRRAVAAEREPGTSHLRLAAFLRRRPAGGAEAIQQDHDEEVGHLLDAVEAGAREAVDLGTQHWEPRLLLAGVAALRRDIDEARRWLKDALDAGYRDLDRLDDDIAFQALGSDEESRQLIEEQRRRIAEMRRRLGEL